jgi:hypothetical protein
MGIFRRWFGKSDDRRPEPEPDSSVTLPYETLIVSGVEAVSACLRLRAEGAGRFTPVILGDPKNLSVLLSGIEGNGDSPETIIDRSQGINMRSFIDKRLAEDGEVYQHVDKGEWPENAAPSEDLVGHTNIGRGTPLKRVAICKVPTPRSWEAPAYLSYGGWNECPGAEEHVALLRYWHEKYGADVITLSNDVIECTVSRPPIDRDQALALAWEQFVYCSDIVLQGTETLSSLAATLCGGKTWFFWWD